MLVDVAMEQLSYRNLGLTRTTISQCRMWRALNFEGWDYDTDCEGCNEICEELCRLVADMPCQKSSALWGSSCDEMEGLPPAGRTSAGSNTCKASAPALGLVQCLPCCARSVGSY
jgi:hypothetical protein